MKNGKLKRLVTLALAVAVALSIGIMPVAGAEATEQKALTIVAAKPATIEDMNTNATSLWLEEKTGIKVTYNQIPPENVSEKVALLLAGSDLPDAFLNCGITSAQMAQYGITDGVFIALDDLIEQYGTNLKAAMSYYDKGLDLLREVDGKIYSLPSINPCYHCSRPVKMWMNNDWLETLGLAAPTTTEEFYNVLTAFRDGDPNGNGVADEIALAGSIDGWYTQSLAFILPSFLYFDYGNYGFNLDDNGNVVNGLSDERFREAMRYINKLYEEGLLYEGTLTQKNDQLKKLVENPDANLVGATTAGYGGQFTTELGGERYRQYRPISPLAGPEGVQYAVSVLQMPGSGALVITSACQQPEVAMQWADTFYTHEATATVYNGLENVAWRWAEDGELDFNGNQAIWTALIPYNGDVGSTQNNCWTQMGIYNFSTEWRMGQSVDQDQDKWSSEGMEYMLHSVTRDMYEPYSADQYCIPTLKYSEDAFTRITDLRLEFQAYFAEAIFNFTTGAWDVDADWETHIQNLETYSLSEMLSIYQTAYDAMYK